MSELSANQYLQLTKAQIYGQSDGLYWDKTNSQLCMVMGGAIVARIDASGITADPEFSGEARGDLMRRGASAWEVFSAKTSGQILIGDGTDVKSVAVSGDVALAANGATTVTDLTITNEARGDLLSRGASAWQRVAAKTAGNIVIGDGTDVISAAMSGHATISSAGVVTLDETLVRYASVNIASDNILGVAAGDIGHASGAELVAAPGLGKAIEFISAVVIFDYAGAAYTGGGDVKVIYPSFSDASGVVTAANSLGAAGDKVAVLFPTVPTNNQLPSNCGLALYATGEFTQPGGAAGVARVKVAYRIHTTGL